MPPVILIPACSKNIGLHAFDAVGRKYIDALLAGGKCTPLMIPPLGEAIDIEGLLDLADGILLTGSPSNVHPRHFEEEVLNPALPLDPARDATTLPLIRRTVERGVPLLAICRGFQEVNVAFGGSLHQAVHAVPGMRDHREDLDEPVEAQYSPAHRVNVVADGVLSRILGVSEMQVNSLHGQGINRLARRLVPEAHAEDGLVEAFHVKDAAGFTLAVQWHPEWKVREHPQQLKIFQAYAAACAAYAASKVNVAAGVST